MLKITEVRLKKVENVGKVKAFVLVTLNDSFVVHGIKVIEGKNGAFVAMPNRKDAEGKYVDVAHPITKEFKDELDKAVFAEFNKEEEK